MLNDCKYIYEFIDEKLLYDIEISMIKNNEITLNITGKIKEWTIYKGLYNADYKNVINKYFDQIKLYYNNKILKDEHCKIISETAGANNRMYPEINAKVVRNNSGEIIELHAIDNSNMFNSPYYNCHRNHINCYYDYK